MELIPLKPFRKTTNELYILNDGKDTYLVKCYLGPHKESRYEREKFILRHWKKLGFNVPGIYEKKLDGCVKPYLVTDFIKGISLREYLCRNEHGKEENLNLLSRLFREMAKRHKLAVANNDCFLVHPDPNTGNIISSAEGLYLIDFEAPHSNMRSVTKSASIEAATICRWAVRDLGIGLLEDVVKRMMSAYSDQLELLNLIISQTSGRQFQFYHRWKDRKKKAASPGEVTKYDIADALSKLL